jgi:hypothetical protein
MKVDAKQSEYKKKIESIDTVILCVAEAERMIARIGLSLVQGLNDKQRQKQGRKADRRTRK